MSFLFPKTANSSQNRAARETQQAVAQSTKGLSNKDLAGLASPLLAEKERLASTGIAPMSLTGPGYGINVNNSGVTMNRTGENQGVMDRLLGGLDTDEAAFGDLLSQITPGFGRLTNARREELERAAAAATSNLRDTLGRRKVAGASFANDQLGSLKAEFAKLTDKALAESMVEELKMTGEVLQARTQARNQTIAQAFDQIQFEGTVGAGLLQTAMTNMNELEKLQVGLATAAAELQLQGRIARGQISASINNTYLGQASQFAGLRAQEAAAPANFLGTLAGAALSGGLGGGGMLSGLASGGLMPAKTSTFEV